YGRRGSHTLQRGPLLTTPRPSAARQPCRRIEVVTSLFSCLSLLICSNPRTELVLPENSAVSCPESVSIWFCPNPHLLRMSPHAWRRTREQLAAPTCPEHDSRVRQTACTHPAPLPHGCFSRFSSSGNATDPKSTDFTTPSASVRIKGGTASRASASIRCCRAATFCGCWSARLVFSAGSCARLKSSTWGGSVACHTSFQSPWRTAARNGSMS